MSRKNDKRNNKFGKGGPDDFREDFYQPSQHSEEEETIDISSFGREYQAQQSEAQSEEAKKIAELMASIDAEKDSDNSVNSKKKKKDKKSKHSFGLFIGEKERENDAVKDEPSPVEEDDENITEAEYEADHTYNNEQPQEVFEEEYFDEQDDIDSEPILPEELDDDFALSGGSEDNTFDEYEYDDSKYDDEFDDDITIQGTEESQEETVDSSEYDEVEAEEESEAEKEANVDEAENEPQEEYYNSEYEQKKPGFIGRLKAFWTGSEDFEEKFDPDFDPSVFDEDEQEQVAEEEQTDAENDEEPYNDADVNIEEKDDTEEIEDGTQSDEEADYTAVEDNSDKSEKSPSLIEKIKAFWNGEDIKNKSIDEEEVTEEEIEAEVEAEKSEWIKSSVKYDDLSDYAPKQRDKAQAQEGSEVFDYDTDYKIEGKGGIFSEISGRIHSFLRPSLGSEEFMQDEELDEEENTDVIDSEEPDVEADEDEQAETVKKASPIEQIKKIWNEDGSYADEQDEQSDEDEEDTIDADYADEEEKPVVSRPVLKVIDPSKPQEEPEEEEAEVDNEETQTEADTETKPEQSLDENIVTEGPDTPVDVVISAKHSKKSLLGKFKSFWNGESIKGKKGKHSDKDKKAEDTEEIKPESKEAQEEFVDISAAEPIIENKPAKTEPVVNDSIAEPVAEQTTAQEAAEELKAEPATFEEVAQEVKIDSVDGRQVVNGKVVPKYIHEDLVEKISLTNENIPLVVRREYEEYIRQAKYRPNMYSEGPELNSEVSRAVKEEMNNPEKSAERLRRKKESAQEQNNIDAQREIPQDKQERRSIKDVLFGNVENSADFSEFRAQTNLNPQNDQVIEDYDKPSDARAIRAEINYDNRKVSFRCITLTILFLITLAFYVIQRYFPTALTQNMPNADIMTCLISLILLIIGAVLCHSTVIGGLKPLIAFKGNSDTAVAVAVVGCLVQGIVSFFEPQAFFSGGMHLYAILAIVALLFNNLGKLCIVRRIKDNFKFASSPNRKYAARIYDNEEVSQQMIDGTNAEKPVVALQSRTKFLKGFLRFSYMPDPSERAASFMAPITTVIAVLAAIICGISTGTASGAVSAFAAVSCMGIPMCCLLAVNIPMRKLCGESLKNRAMIIGYPAVKTFSETSAVMVDSRELYPRGKVQLLSVKTFNTYNIDKALLNAAAVMKVANTPMTYMFEDVISEKGEQLPEVESVKYEDGKGLVSWVGGERLLLGNRDLMKKYSINLPSLDFEESSIESRSNCITYLANAGQLVAMLVTEYHADQRLASELSRLEKNGVTILIRTADPNVSQLKVAKDFGVFIRNVKILPTTLGNICKDEMSRRDESSRAFISTEGKLHSLARAISGCIKIKDNISIAIVIQVLAVALGVLIAVAVSVFSGLNGLNGIDLLLYVLFWAAASIIAPLIQKA
ncbi:hypothetical protein [Ruminococcus sp. zg-924]|nr:hypothetical protein [Ruminococcus sp. zg-924]MCQ4023042.1 hypothetical protein [Ruminococcus sp. zg-924]MCQ4115479.1 hypothetical protein [Ruminococcus sp. zg-921]